MKKIMKITRVIGIIFILFVFYSGCTHQEVAYTESQHHTDSKMLHKAFAVSNADLVGINMNFWAEIKNKDYSLEEMEEIIDDFEKILGVESQLDTKIEENEESKKVVTTIQEESKMIITIIMESCILQNGNINNYLLMDISLSEKYEDVEKLEEKIIESFSKQNLDYNYSMTLIGNFEKRMNTDIMREVIGNSFRAVEAEEIEGIVEDEYSEMVSLSGYSPNIYKSIQLSEKEININAAMRYNEHDESTYIWIGVPMIATEY